MLNIVDKILEFAVNQMLSRLPISLAHSKAGNNSDSLYRSKKLTKVLYKSLIDII